MARKKVNYPERIGFMVSKELKKIIEDYAAKEGVKPAVILRKATVDFLKSKEILDKDKNYL